MTCCILHFFQALICLAAGLSVENLKKFKTPLNTVFTYWDKDYPEARLEESAQLPFVPVTSGFAWLSAVAHLIVLLNYPLYLSDLRKGINRFRWYEYALSSSLMIALIAILFGCYDILSLILMMAVNACMCLFGLLMETMNVGKTSAELDWTPFIYGCFAGAVPWAVIFAYLGGAGKDFDPPEFVWVILIFYIIFFNCFAINMFLQYKEIGWWSDKYWGWKLGGYYFGEKVYQILSLFSKSMLLWLVFGGSNQPNKMTENSGA